MGRHHILNGKGLDASVREIQKQIVLWYDDQASRDADIPLPWDGCTTLYPSSGALRLEMWWNGVWNQISGGGSGGVTDHGALTGLLDDDHTQYLTSARGDALFLTPAEGNAAYDAINAASNGDAAHVAAADPHPVYYNQTRGDGRYTRYRTAPGAMNIDTITGYGTWAFAAASGLSGLFPTAPFDPAKGFDLWQTEAPSGTKILQRISQGTGRWQRGWLTASSAWGSWFGSDSTSASWGIITANRVDVTDPTPGAGGYATQRFFHDNNVDHMAISVTPTGTPGYEIFDSRDPATLLLRVARGERVKFPANGHQHKWQASGALASASWASAGFVQMPLSVRDDPGNLVKSNYILLPDIGYYTANAVVAGMDRAISGITELIIRIVSSATNDAADVIWTGTAGKLSYSASAAAFYVPAINAQLQFFVYMPNAMAVAPSASGALVVSSLF